MTGRNKWPLNCRECKTRLDDEWRCPECDTGPKVTYRPLIPSGAIPVEVTQDSMTLNTRRVYRCDDVPFLPTGKYWLIERTGE